MKKSIIIGLATILFISTQSFSKQDDQLKKEACDLMKSTYKTCYDLAKKNNIYKIPFECNNFSVRAALEMFDYLYYKAKAPREDAKGFAELVGGICFGACNGDLTIKKQIDEVCK